MLKAICRTKAEFSTLLLRLALGAVMFPHGAQKALGWFGGKGLEATVDGFAGMGIPAWQAYLVVAAEFLGSIGLILGLGTRLAAAGIVAVMAGAIYHVHWKNGFIGDGGFEFQMLIAVVAFVLVLKGGGAFSVDRKLAGSID